MSAPGKVEVPTSLETERLLLRCPQPEDALEVNTAVRESLPELRPWMSWAVEPLTLEQSEANMRESREKFLKGISFQFLIFLKNSSTIIGSTGFHEPDWNVPAFEIGYWVRTAYAGHGYIHEAVKGLSAMAFGRLGAHRVQIVCNADNLRSAAVARRAGYEMEGIRRNAARHHLSGELYDEIVFSKVR